MVVYKLWWCLLLGGGGCDVSCGGEVMVVDDGDDGVGG